MKATIPSSLEVRAQLEMLGYGEVQALVSASGVPFTTLWKIREGETVNPGLETVRKFLPHLRRAIKGKARAAVE
jgi:hypothetical protein